MTKHIDELVASMCDATDQPLAVVLRQWCAESRLFLAFAEAHATKIRKKVRLAATDDQQADVLAELSVAALFARDRRFAVRYEPSLATGLRAPDLHVTLKTHATLYVEATRLRLRAYSEAEPNKPALKLARVLGDKIGQFPAGAMNLLAVIVPVEAASDALAPAALRLLDTFSQHEGHATPADFRVNDVRAFQRQRQRLSGVAVCAFDTEWRPQVIKLWLNLSAKHPLHPDIPKYLAQLTP